MIGSYVLLFAGSEEISGCVQNLLPEL